MLALDPPLGAQAPEATIGGVFATADSARCATATAGPVTCC